MPFFHGADSLPERRTAMKNNELIQDLIDELNEMKLPMMASTLEMPLDRMSREGLLWKKDLDISSVCTVFAESEVVSLIAQDTETADIIHALNKAVAAKTSGMVKRVRGCGPYIMTGGVARNSGVVSEMEKRLSEKIIIPKEPELNGAIGAALCAIEGL